LKNGIDGLELISEDLELVMMALDSNKVPEMWKFCYYSLKPLMGWILDLKRRMEMFTKWAAKG